MPSNSLLRQVLTFQGIFYLLTNLWALLATEHFLSFNNPQGDIFEARAFAALCLVIAIFFLVGAWNDDLLRPAAFLGLGSAVAIVLVELFHLPYIGWTLLWLDLGVEIALAVVYITAFFLGAKPVAQVKDRAPIEEVGEEKKEEPPAERGMPVL